MQKTYDVCRHRHTNEIRLLSKREQHDNRNFEPISYRVLTVAQLSELLKETFPQRYKTYVQICLKKYDKQTAKQKIYDSAVIGELQP
jgi:hypothetical protein